MDMKDRIKEAMEALRGTGARVVRPGRKSQSPRTRPVSSIKSDKDVKAKKQPGKAVYHQCLKKHRYRSEHDARLAANNAETKRGTRLRVYQCPLCGGWHITRKYAAEENR